MPGPPPPRKQVDLTKLPRPVLWGLVAATIAVVVGLVLLVGGPTGGRAIPVSAIIAALIAFAFVAWRRQHR